MSAEKVIPERKDFELLCESIQSTIESEDSASAASSGKTYKSLVEVFNTNAQPDEVLFAFTLPLFKLYQFLKKCNQTILTDAQANELILTLDAYPENKT